MSSSVIKTIKTSVLNQGIVTLENVETSTFNTAFAEAAHAQGVFYHSHNPEDKARYNYLFTQVKDSVKRTLRSRQKITAEEVQVKKMPVEEISFTHSFSLPEWLADVSKSWRRADIAIALAGGSFD